MPLFLTTLITSLFGALMDFFIRFLSKKLALAAVFLTITIAMTTAFILALNAAVSTIAYAMPAFLSDSFGLFMPNNVVICITAVYASKVAKFVWDRNRDIVDGQQRLFS